MNNNTFYRTFSGADAVAFMILPSASPILLGSLTTVSYSMYRDKKPVTLVGKINVSGFTRGMRIIAGSLVFTLINQHLSKDIVEQVDYIKAHSKIKADELPPFDIMVVCANEYGQTSRMMIYGIDITDDSQVVSVEDMYTENVFNFVARDVDEFTEYKEASYANSITSGQNYRGAMTRTTFGFDMLNGYLSNIHHSTDLFYEVQKHLYEIKEIEKVTNVFDNETVAAVKNIQKRNGLIANGILDETTFNIIFQTKESSFIADTYIVNNFLGANVYKDKEFTSKVSTIRYGEKICATFTGEGECRINIREHEFFLDPNDITLCSSYSNVLRKIGVGEEQTRNIFELEHVGVIVEDDTYKGEIKASCVSVYKDDKKKHFSKVYKDITGFSTISLRELTLSFIYDIDHDSFPHTLYYVIQINDIFYRWKVNLKVE